MTAFSNKVVAFGGTDEYVTMGNVLGFERDQAFSISFWFKTTSTSNGYTVAKQGDSNPEGWSVGVDGSGHINLVMTHTWITNCISVWSTTGTGNDGVWHHGVVVFDGVTYPSSASAVKIYMDGVERPTAVGYDTLTSDIANSFAFTLARRIHSSSPQYFVGSLDEVAIYSKVLSAAEVAWIYNGYNPRDLTGVGAPTGLVAWWRMGEGDTYPTLLDTLSTYPGTMVNMESSDITSEQIAGYEGYEIPLLGTAYSSPGGVAGYIIGGGGGPTVTTYYKMRAQDLGATPPGYVTWIAQDEPDFIGAGYSGGTPAPIGAMADGSATVVATWQE